MSDHARLLEVARRAVIDASVVCRRVQRGLDELRAITKDDRSPVTIADFAAQAVVMRILREELGQVHMLAEESTSFLREPRHAAHLEATVKAAAAVWSDATAEAVLDFIDSGAAARPTARETAGLVGGFWTLDPIDGTKGFLRAQQYCVCLAYIEHGVPVVGALGCPNLPRDFSRPLEEPDPHGSLYLAIAGEGVYEAACDPSFRDHEPIHIRRLDHVPGSPITMVESIESAHSDQSASAKIMALLGPRAEPVRIDSQCKYAVVARGQADAYLRLPTRKDYVERIWDHAAGALIASEAGCAVTDIRCRQLDFSHGAGLEKNRGIVVAPPRLHGRIIGAIEELGLG
jgi:3'(2'), 5'-bisphosphate nucleotidase